VNHHVAGRCNSRRPTCQRYGSRGNALVELAMIIVPMTALMFAIVDFGLAIFARSSMQHAVREGVRYAVTYQTKSGMGHDASIKDVVQQNSMGFLKGPAGLEKIHVRYYAPDSLVEVPENAPGNVVEVSVEGYNWNWIVPIMRTKTPWTITVRSGDRMEGLPGGTAPPAR